MYKHDRDIKKNLHISDFYQCNYLSLQLDAEHHRYLLNIKIKLLCLTENLFIFIPKIRTTLTLAIQYLTNHSECVGKVDE